jgi:hypothetical protein
MSAIIYPNPHAADCPWHGLAAWFGAPNIKWCEQTVCAWISEPANAWSNVGYFLAGAFIIHQARSCAKLAEKHLRALGHSVLFMGLMSFVYHASNAFPGQWLDFIGMFLMFGSIIERNFDCLNIGHASRRRLLVLSLVGVFSLIIPFLYSIRFQYQILVVVFALLAFALEFIVWRRVRSRSSRFLLVAAILFLAAFLASVLDHGRWYCNPVSRWLHGHVFWHLLSACGFVALAAHWRQSDLESALQ